MVLVSPRNPLNIGAVARAMANFGFRRLSVVAPYEPHWREARSAVGSAELLHQAKKFQTLAEAVSECTFVLGTGTLTHRKPEQRVILTNELTPRIAPELTHSGRIGVVFGPEKHGLTREDLSCCHLFVQIPTDPRQPSMNLGQAAAVVLYELAIRTFDDSSFDLPETINSASGEPKATTSGDLEILAGLIEEVMVAAKYSPDAMQSANRYDLRVLLRRLQLQAADNRRVLGLFRRILWRLKHGQP